ncbi:MAG: hypothetical protein AAGJ08_28685 [Cyanobacteria bacterium P01_H01_bin.35]
MKIENHSRQHQGLRQKLSPKLSGIAVEKLMTHSANFLYKLLPQL